MKAEKKESPICPIGKRYIPLNSALMPGMNFTNMSDEDLISLKKRVAD